MQMIRGKWKYWFSVVITILTYKTTNSWQYVCVGLAELCIIISLTNLFYRLQHVRLAYVFNVVLSLLYNIQMIMLIFAGEYIQLVMLSNISSIGALNGRIWEYGIGFGSVILFSLLPPAPTFKERVWKNWGGFIFEILFVCIWGTTASPMLSYGHLAVQAYQLEQLRKSVETGDFTSTDLLSVGVGDGIAKDTAISDKPNVILIFTEGMSQNIIDDERNIMPNLAALQKKSLNFTGYYNHTFATYRGVIGQLYSGYQLNDMDENKLVSIQSVLKDEGYHTVFINTEPNNEDWTSYVNSFGFDDVIGSEVEEKLGVSATLSDKQAFELLYQTVSELADSSSPFFTVIYTFGTHVSLDSDDEKYADGSNRLLNRFYNWDAQMGNFVDKVEKNSTLDDTILIFTTDHATFSDDDFKDTFSEYQRLHPYVDEIPLSIYYKGIEPVTYDVGGRNSLDLTPTILDYLDISAPNFFLGKSLFLSEDSSLDFDTLFNEESIFISTYGGKISSLTTEERDIFEPQIKQYFSVKLQNNESLTEQKLDSIFVDDLEWTFSDDGEYLILTYTPSADSVVETYLFAVWSDQDGQDDIVWYVAEKNEDGTYCVTVRLHEHLKSGGLNVHIYGDDTCLTTASIIVNQ